MVADLSSISVTAPDGTAMSVFASGKGRALVAVHGTSSYQGTWNQLRPLLQPHLRFWAMDRRGRGASGDGPRYSLEREYDDVAAVVDAVARVTGGSVDLLGHSYGGNVAFGAALRTTNLRRLVLYEGWPPPNPAHRTSQPGFVERLDDLLALGQREQALVEFLREAAKVTPAEIEAVKASPAWPQRLAAAHTVPRELRAFASSAFDPAHAARITVPVLLLIGEDSPDDVRADPEVVAAAMPDARVRVLPGQGHVAHLSDPEGFAAELLAFLSEP